MYQLSKPAWLKRWLGYLNWDILTWHVYVGDAIESAIDWVLEKINYVLEWAQSAYDWAQAAWSKITETANWLWSEFCKALRPIVNAIDTWQSTLNNWWSAQWSKVLDAISTIKSSLADSVSYIQTRLNSIRSELDSFIHNTLPQLATINLVETVKSYILKELASPINSWLAVQKEVTEFITNPTQWFMKHFEKILGEWW